MDPVIDKDGFRIVPDVLSENECDELINSLGSTDGRAGTRHLMNNSEVRAVAHDPRLRTLAGGGIPFRATLFHKTGKANWLIPWHQDTALPLATKFDGEGWGPWSWKSSVWYAHAPESALKRVLALRLHLDSSTAQNGPLRVIPGSHHRLLTDAQVEELAAAASAFDCLSPSGGVIVMRPLLVHASSKIVNDLPRRVLHIEYVDSLVLGVGVELKVV